MGTILCIEDEPDILESLVEELSDTGYLALAARDGREGLETIIRERPDLVICDISMPVMDGYELLKAVRANGSHARMPFVFLSALTDRDERIRGLHEGADEYLTKPVDFSILLSKVEAILRMRRRMQADRRDDTSRKVGRVFQSPCEQAGTAPDDISWK